MDLTWIDHLDPSEEIMLLEPRATFDRAIVGLVQQFSSTFVLYSRSKVLAALVEVDAMTPEEADEWWSYNMAGAWVGRGTPAFLLDGAYPTDIGVAR
tara:strand:+ start:1500 stop:1790 length:291 start_codon:yes stop_codon:yes gene_type:complete